MQEQPLSGSSSWGGTTEAKFHGSGSRIHNKCERTGHGLRQGGLVREIASVVGNPYVFCWAVHLRRGSEMAKETFPSIANH